MMENESALESRIKNGSKNIEDYRLLGKIYFDKGQYDRVLELYETASTLPLSNEERGIILHDKGQASDLLGKKEDAISCFEKSLNLLVSEEDAGLLHFSGMNHYSLSRLLYHEKKGAEHAGRALEKFETLVQKYPDYEEKKMIYGHMSELYGRLGELDKAVTYFRKAIESAANDEERIGFLLGIGPIYRDRGDYEKSEEACKQALVLAKGKRHLAIINFELGKTCFVSNRVHDAIEAFKKALEFLEFDPVMRSNKEYAIEIFYGLGLLYYQNEEYDQAIGHLDKASENVSSHHEYYCSTHMTLGHCYLAKGEFDRARSYYVRALSTALVTEEDIKMANECLEIIDQEHEA